MNLVHIPFHDYRKAINEGFRTRDTHLIDHLIKCNSIEDYKIVNRPILILEILKNPINYISYLKERNTEIVYDQYDFGVVKPLLLRRKYIYELYSKINYKITGENILTHVPYSIEYINRSKSGKIIFDALDNWLKTPFYSDQTELLKSAYSKFSNIADMWITNSEENKNYFHKEFNVKKIEVIKNGVDPEKFSIDKKLPKDLKNIDSPLFGFAGKITHLIDLELLRELSNSIDKGRIVIIGKVIDKSVFKELINIDKVTYLGDKSYQSYPNYIKSFDVLLIPYKTGSKAHGGDSIKFYEYLCTGRPIVSTDGNGIYQYNELVFISNTHKEFVENCIKVLDIDSTKKVSINSELTWAYKTQEIVKIFESL